MTKLKAVLIREEMPTPYDKALNADVGSAEVSAKLFRDVAFLDKSPQEELWALYLDLNKRCIGLSLISIGDTKCAIVSTSAIFRQAILANASAVVIAHNHPSGDITPSKDDKSMTKAVKQAGKLLGIQLFDHIIIGVDNEQYYSFMEQGKL